VTIEQEVKERHEELKIIDKIIEYLTKNKDDDSYNSNGIGDITREIDSVHEK